MPSRPVFPSLLLPVLRRLPLFALLALLPATAVLPAAEPAPSPAASAKLRPITPEDLWSVRRAAALVGPHDSAGDDDGACTLVCKRGQPRVSLFSPSSA